MHLIHKVRIRFQQQNTFFYYSLSSLALQASVMVSAFFVLRYVAPELVGIWRTLILLKTYGDIINLGITRGLNRELPLLLGQDETARAHQVASTAQVYVLFMGLISGGLMIGLALTIADLPAEWFIALLGLGIYWFASSYRSYLVVTFRAESEFRNLTKQQVIESIINIVSLILVVYMGYRGMILRYVILSLFIIALLHVIRPIRVRLKFNFLEFRKLAKVSLPIYISGYLITASMAFTQTIILQRGSTEMLGLYAPVASITTIMIAIRSSISTYINPRMMYKLGQQNDAKVVRHSVLTITTVTAIIAVPLAVILILIAPTLLSTLFPQYLDATPALQINIINGMFLAVNATIAGLYGLKAWRLMFFYVGVMLALRWILPWQLIELSLLNDILADAVTGELIANIMIFLFGISLVQVAVSKNQLNNKKLAAE